MIEQLDAMTGGNGPVALTILALLAFLAVMLAARRLEPALARGPLGSRLAKYQVIIVRSWTLGAFVLFAMWAIEMRTGRHDLALALDEIGLHLRLPAYDVLMWTAGMVVAATIVGTAIVSLRTVLGGKPTRAAVDLLPVTPAETAVFSLLVSPTAGVVEEFVYRGFLMSFLWGYTGDGWVAAAISSAVFGLMHFYQGAWGVVRTGAVGFVFAAGVVMTGSLIPSIIAHTLVNMLGVSFRVTQRLRDAAA